MEILVILGVLAVGGILAFKIIVSIKYRGMRYNWFRFRREGYDIGLDKHDVLLMRNTAYESRVPDFSMMYTSTKILDKAVLHSVDNIRKAKNMSEDDKNTKIERLFLLRSKMDGIATGNRQPITSTAQLRKNQPVELIFERIGSYRTVIVETADRFFSATMPQEALDVQDYTWEGKKVRVKCYVPNDAEYTFVSRVLEQSSGGDGAGHLNIEHTKSIARTQKRIFRRNNVSIAASLYNLRITGEGASRKITVVNNAPINGTIVNLSAGGLSVKSQSGNLKENMIVKFDFSLDFERTEIAIGRILAVTTIPNSPQKFFHVRFERISRKTRNNIFEYIYRGAADEKKNAPRTIIPQRDGSSLSIGAPEEKANGETRTKTG
jgi:c-di-GMP-binding flagellar brake protein YcgR